MFLFPFGATIGVAVAYAVLRTPASYIALILSNGTLFLLSFFMLLELLAHRIDAADRKEKEIYGILGALFIILFIYFLVSLVYIFITIPSADRLALASEINFDFSAMLEKHYVNLCILTALNIIFPLGTYAYLRSKFSE